MPPPPNDNDAQKFPEPLEFLTTDFIHPDNEAVIQREAMRWRLLGFWERIKLKRYVASLARQLKRGHYNELVLERQQLGRRFHAARKAYREATYTSREAKALARHQLLRMTEHGHQLNGLLADLAPTAELWQHYSGWLTYEREHRRDLQIEAKREKRIRSEMRKESKFLEGLVRDVFRATPGCHYTYKTDGGKEKTRVPKFERVVIKADAHWLYLRTATKLPFFGYKWRLPPTVTTSRLQEDEVVENLRAGVKRQAEWFWTDQNQLVLRIARLDSPDALPRHVRWRDAMKFFPAKRGARFPYTIGVKDDRVFHWLDFASDPNVLVAGTAGSGKSNLVNGILATLVSTHSPSELRLVLIDQKGGIEFTHWEELPHLLWEMVKTSEEVQPVLTKLVAIMRRRMTMLQSVKAKTFDGYNNRVDEDKRLERLVIAIDEMSNFVGLGERTEEIHNLIMLLVSQGRAVGVHVIACTQHPEVKVIPGRIKTNMSVRLCGWMPTISASQIVLDNPEAARLPKLPGRFVGARGMEVLVIQCPEITDEDIQGVVGAARLAYPDVANDIRDMAGQPTMVVWNEQRVMKASIEWLEGRISAKELHRHLGSESPGERHLSKMCRSLTDEFTAMGSLTLNETGTRWTVIRKGNARILKPLEDKADDGGDDNDAMPITAAPEPESLSPSLSAAD